MGANDVGEQLAAAKEECIRLEAEVEALKGAVLDAGRNALLEAADDFECAYWPRVIRKKDVQARLRGRAGAR